VNHPLTEQEFLSVYAKVPRLTVEVVLRDARGVFLTQRDTGPCAGMWHIPGGTVRFGEPLEDAVARVALAETGVVVAGIHLLGWIEYPGHVRDGIGCPVGMAFGVAWDGEPEALDGASAGGWFSVLPADMHEEQAAFLAGLAASAGAVS
jgi:ADP-ribose pyrophosphatase YjhB (NUDIX family)